MEVSYNLRYQKQSFNGKNAVDKEGEVVIYAKGFRLKGKGAGDKGELINFSEIKEFYHRNEKVIFVTFGKEKYILSEVGTMFEQMLKDLYKSRNEFLQDALFMKGGKLKAQFEGSFERISKFGKFINKGKGKLCLYESSLVVIPELQDAFAVHYDFVNFHEFDDMEYKLKIVLDSGVTVFISQLGNDYEFFEEKMNMALGGMYGVLVNDVLKEAFPFFDAGTLLKLAYKMKSGKSVSLKDMQKMDSEMAEEVDKFVFKDEAFVEKMSYLREMCDEYSTYFGIAKDDAVAGGFVRWVMFAIPEKNVVAFSILPRWGSEEGAEEAHETYFYKIIMEKGSPADKVQDKTREIDQALVVLDFAKDPCYKDKRELRHSPYQYAIRKLPYLRILRKSYVGKAAAVGFGEWKKQAEAVMAKAKLG